MLSEDRHPPTTEDSPEKTFCKVTDTNSSLYYDLSGLKPVNETEDWKIESKGFDYNFRLSVCEVLKDPGDVLKKEKAGVWGKKIPDDKEYNLGYFNTTPYLKDDMLFLIYETNDYCGADFFYRTSLIRFICDQTVDKTNPPKLINVFNDCAFWFEWRTPIACPTKIVDSQSAISVFFTILGIALAVYFIGGVIYNRIVYNASGVRQIPHWEFWRDAFDFIKVLDMFLIILAQCPIPFFQPRRRPGNYRNLPRDEEHILIDEQFEEH
ncbi:23927_t:CDS:2 [Gigaspora margarita]|uniref:23927_t:CDS:1 n=1 Tax=Gigaspora margarita TaxID=4874 RepID=A0ABN7V667_GIGMA|nr:23927_t:CDS:2 [Gigaspora margarita]